jgi:sulfate-transporting ATPase
MDVLRFALIGIGAGAAYVLIAQGIVLIYRGSGVLNFAQGGIAMVGAQVFYSLRDEHSTPAPVAFVAAIGLCAAIGAAMQLLVLRRLRGASALVRLTSTLALLALIQGVGALVWNPDGGARARIVDGIFPTSNVALGHGVLLSQDRIVVAGIAVVLTGALWVVYSRLRYGLATSAVAENQQAAVALGWSADVIASVNWAIGAALAGVAGILLSPLTGLSVTALVLTVIPGLAAALVGRFSSFGLTMCAGLLIAAVQSDMARYVHTPGWADAVPFLVIVAFVMVRGRALPIRGELLDRPVRVGSGRLNVLGLVVTVLGLAALVPRLSGSWPTAFALTVTAGMVAVSIVLITGYAGQISLAQLTIAGVGALTAAWASSHGMPFLVSVLLAAATATATGLIVALPALRCRGANLAVVTIGLSLCIESLVLTNPTLIGGYAGYTLRAPTVFGAHVDLLTHPDRFGFVVSAAFVISAILVANVRRGRTGRRLLAVRSNERAAAVSGINVLTVKLYAFGLGSAISGTAGALMAYMYPRADLSGYTTLGSITLLLNVVIGGTGFIASSALAGVGAPGGVLPQVVSELDSRWGSIVTVVSGAGVLLVLASHPHGLVDVWASRADKLRRQLRARRAPVATPHSGSSPSPADRPESARGARQLTALTITDLSVSFGSVKAVRGVNLAVRSGEVVGLIGPNGAGKTTVVDAVTGLVRAHGRVALGECRIDGLAVRARTAAGISRTFQAVELFDDMTVSENIRSAAERTDNASFLLDLVWPRREPLPDVALAAVQELELNADLDAYPESMTTGRQRLVGIARALATNPAVVLMDEPTAGLDDAETAELGRLIRRLARDWGLAVLLIEHDINLVSSVCDRVVAMALGEVIGEGTPAAVLSMPAVVEAYMGPAEDSRSGGTGSSRQPLTSGDRS